MEILSNGDSTFFADVAVNNESIGIDSSRVRRACCCTGSVIFSLFGLLEQEIAMSATGTISARSRKGFIYLAFKNKEHGKDEANKCRKVIPVQLLPFKNKHHYHRKQSKGYHLLYHLELQKVKWSAIVLESNPVGRNGEAVLKESNAP